MTKKKTDPKEIKKLKFEKIDQSVKHYFDDEEIAEIAREQSRKIASLETVKQEKKSIVAEFTSQEKALELEIRRSALLVRNGYDFREKPCFAFQDFKAGKVFYFLAEKLDMKSLSEKIFDASALVDYLTNAGIDPVKIRKMSDAERQIPLFDEEKPESLSGTDPEPVVDAEVV